MSVIRLVIFFKIYSRKHRFITLNDNVPQRLTCKICFVWYIDEVSHTVETCISMEMSIYLGNHARWWINKRTWGTPQYKFWPETVGFWGSDICPRYPIYKSIQINAQIRDTNFCFCFCPCLHAWYHFIDVVARKMKLGNFDQNKTLFLVIHGMVTWKNWIQRIKFEKYKRKNTD